MTFRPLTLAAAILASPFALAQSGTGEYWTTFGPDRSDGVFLNITRQHLRGMSASGLAVDHKDRLYVMNEWTDSGSINRDCGVTRHIVNARLLDMDYTGPEELEATRRISPDLGGPDYDVCTSIAIDRNNKAVIGGWGTTAGANSGFIVRLGENGAPDTTFSSDGQLALGNLVAFSGTFSTLSQVLPVDDKILACGAVERGTFRNMLIVRFNGDGTLDTGFSGNGYAEVDFGVSGDRNDRCDRLVALPNGNIIIGGIVTDHDADQSYGLAQLTSTGAFVSAFGNNGRLLIDDGSQLAATPNLTDLVWDAANNRVMVGCYLTFSAGLQPSSCILAIRASNGTLDTGFDGDGRLGFRFHTYGSGTLREPGGSRLKRLLMREDGSFFALGTHTNSTANALTYGETDIVSMRFEANGSVIGSGANAYAGDGNRFHVLTGISNGNLPVSTARKVAEKLVDAMMYQGNPVMLADVERYPAGVFDADGDGNINEPGPIAPVVVATTADHLFKDDFDFDGIPPASPQIVAIIPTPPGYGNYCSVRNPANGSFGLLPQGSGSDPCQVFLDGNPNLIIERAGKYALNGTNWVVGVCSGNFITLRPGIGTAPFDLAFNDASGRSNCVFTATPAEFKVFERPYSGTNLGVGNTQSFNHDPYKISIDVSDFGQTSTNGFNACAIDNRGRQRSIGNPDTNPSTCNYDNSGVNEPAMDIGVDGSRMVQSVGAGFVSMAVPRHVPGYAPAGMDPYQREVFVRHLIGGGRYAEEFTTYYAHMQDTAVRRGDHVSAGTVLGRVGTTGSSSGEHLHLSVIRHRNLTFRPAFELGFEGGRHDRDASVAAVDPFGWQAPQGVDPWAWRFRSHASNPLLDDAGSFSSLLWKDGEAPPLQ